MLIREVGGPQSDTVLYRTWVRDPSDGWIRVIMAYVDSGSIADIDAERRRVVDALRRGGARRCCVEVAGVLDVGDVHRWLEQRAVVLNDPRSRPDASPAMPTLAADARFVPAPGSQGSSARLVDWATGRSGVTGLITAQTEVGGGPVPVIGVLVEPDADREAIRAEATQLVDPAVIVESFAPAAGMTPVQFRLYRGSSRLWTRPVQRPATPSLRLDTTYRPRASRLEPVIEVGAPIGDERLPDGFALVGLDLNTSLQKGADQPDDRDTAAAEWAAEQEHLLALLRAEAPEQRGTTLPVYSLLVDQAADRDALRRALATLIAGTGLDRCAIEAYCPFERLSVFQVQLYGASLPLWKTDRRRSASSGPDQTV